MSANNKHDKEARRLRELLKGRLDKDTAVKLIKNCGGLQQAVNFMLKGDPAEVQEFLNQSESYTETLRKDAQKLESLLKNGIQASIRLFACKKCNKYWWRRVPARKEVSRCNGCRVRYDPIPTDMEWGIGKFICLCGNEFPGFGEMGVTYSPCYNCRTMVPISHMLPPRKNVAKKTKAPHCCNAPDCIGAHGGHRPMVVDNITSRMKNLTVAVYDGRTAAPSSGNRGSSTAPPSYGYGQAHQSSNGTGGLNYNRGGYRGTAAQPQCVHPKANFVIRTFSTPHRSSGSTVTTFLSQGSLDNQSIRCDSSLNSIQEED
ncbi:hypothetical protein Btru_061700 [Bulinus truncatus]|nr:hypothetical protein Btru_061700 [Bulinus truncatus]